jgi:hypothetical protein
MRGQRMTRRPVTRRIATTLTAVALCSLAVGAQQPPAPRAPRLVGGCPSSPRAFYECASAKAKTFTPPRTPDGQPNLQGVWEAPMAGGLNNIEGRNPNRAATTLVVDPPDGTIPYQPWAREQKTENATKYIDPYYHCTPITAPRIMASLRARQILQFPGLTTIVNESGGHSFRTVYLDGRPHLSSAIKQWRGDSRGRWDGNTLEIETTNLAGLGWFSQGGDFFSDALKMTERLALVDANTILYTVSIDDPKISTRPWTIAFALERANDKGYEVMEEACWENEVDTPELLAVGMKVYTGPRYPK